MARSVIAISGFVVARGSGTRANLQRKEDRQRLLYGKLGFNLSPRMERKPAVAVVFHHIGPYHHARLNAAADRLSVTGIEWSAKGYDAWGAAATPVRYHKVSLFPEATAHSPGNAKLKQAFWAALEQARPDVVAVNGWNNFGSLIAANCCVRRGIPMVVMSESSRQDEPRTWWKEAIKRRIAGLYLCRTRRRAASRRVSR